MQALVASVLLAGATATIGYFFQARETRLSQEADAKQENERRWRNAELERAEEIFDEISPAMDALYYYLRHGAMHVAVRKAKDDNTRKDQDAETWNGYEKALSGWMTHKRRFAALVRQCFGEKNHKRLEDIQDNFQKGNSLVRATYYNGEKSIVKDGEENSEEFDEIVKPLANKLVDFNEQMIKDIQTEKVGRLRQTQLDEVKDGKENSGKFMQLWDLLRTN